MTLTFGSLCSGVGMIDLGLERAGMHCLFQVEIDRDARGVLEQHYPSVYRGGDVTHEGRGTLPAVDLVAFGFPCSDISVAGLRKGLAGERSGIFFECHRVLTELRPRWCVIENVPNLLSTNGGRDFALVLGCLTGSLPRVPDGGWRGAGFARGPFYKVAWRVLDAQYFGVPQRRRRIVIVGHLGDGRAAEVLFEREGMPGDFAPRRQARARVTGTLADSSGSRGWSSSVDVQAWVEARHGAGDAGTVTARARKGVDSTATSPLAIQALAWDNAQITSAANRTRVEAGLPASTLAAGSDMMVAHALTAEGADASEDGTLGVRRLTPRECERLQGLPDDWTRYGVGGKEQSDSKRYKQIGNGAAVPKFAWVGQRIVQATREGGAA